MNALALGAKMKPPMQASGRKRVTHSDSGEDGSDDRTRASDRVEEREGTIQSGSGKIITENLKLRISDWRLGVGTCNIIFLASPRAPTLPPSPPGRNERGPQKAARMLTLMLPEIGTTRQTRLNSGSQIVGIEEMLGASEVRSTQWWDHSDEIAKRILGDITAAFLTYTFHMPMIFRERWAVIWDDPLPQWPTGTPGSTPGWRAAVRANRMLESSGPRKKEKRKG